MVIKNFESFVGVHCETTTAGCLLKSIGINLSEPMLFGIGEGLGFLIWNMKIMDFPFIGGRIKPDLLTDNICRNLDLNIKVHETSSQKKAWEMVREKIDQEKLVGLKLDCYHLEYFTAKIHFAGHYVAMYGYDSDYAYLNDTTQQGCKVKTSLESLKLARSEKGPMSSRNRMFTIQKGKTKLDLKCIIKKAIYKNATDYLNPPIKNFGYKGIQKASAEILKWFERSDNIKYEFQTCSMLMEKAGTGGSLFRNIYRDFLKESYNLLHLDEIMKAYNKFQEVAKLWKEVADLFYLTGETENKNYITQASDILMLISKEEKAAMEELLKVKY